MLRIGKNGFDLKYFELKFRNFSFPFLLITFQQISEQLLFWTITHLCWILLNQTHNHHLSRHSIIVEEAKKKNFTIQNKRKIFEICCCCCCLQSNSSTENFEQGTKGNFKVKTKLRWSGLINWIGLSDSKSDNQVEGRNPSDSNLTTKMDSD